MGLIPVHAANHQVLGLQEPCAGTLRSPEPRTGNPCAAQNPGAAKTTRGKNPCAAKPMRGENACARTEKIPRIVKTIHPSRAAKARRGEGAGITIRLIPSPGSVT